MIALMDIANQKLFGISVKTTNENGQYMTDIPELWGRFFSEGIYKKGKIYALYTDYEGDYTKPYRFFLGCSADSFDTKPEGLEEIIIPEGNYEKRCVDGIFPQCVVEAWQEIWESDIPRAYTTDVEVYPNAEMPPEKMDLYLAVR